MGIRFYCPNGHKLNVKKFQAGRRGICPYCGSKFVIPTQSTRKSAKEERAALRALADSAIVDLLETPPQAASAPKPGSPAESPAAVPFAGASPQGGTPLVHARTNADASPQPTPFSSQQSQAAKQTAHSSSIPTGSPSIAAAAAPIAPVSFAAVPGALVDPITAAGNVVWYVRPPGGGQFGPATGGIIRHWLAEGRITPDTLVWREGWRDWQKASAVFPQFRFKHSLTELAQAATPSMTPAPGAPDRPSTPEKSHKSQRLMVTLLSLVVCLLIGIFLWLIIHGLPFTTNNSTPSDQSPSTQYTQSSPHSVNPNRPPH
jgi:hypothetical protein